MSQDAIRLREQETAQIDLTEDEVGAILRMLQGKLQIAPTWEHGLYNVTTRSYVGIVPLPTGRPVLISPKVPVETLFALLAAIYDPSREIFHDDPASYTTVEALFEFVVCLFVSHVEDLITRGILRGYRTSVEDGPVLRGRLLLTETIRHHPGLHNRFWFAFSRFTPDVLENRILRWTAFSLLRFPYRDSTLPSRLRRIDRTMSDVILAPDAHRLFSRLAYHRLNDPYRPALELARLLLDQLTFSGTPGSELFLAFLIEMNQLFQDYVTVEISAAARNWGLGVLSLPSYPLDWDGIFKVIPDVVLTRNGIPLLVVDAKYKLEEAQNDIYQMVSYCHALGIDRAVLVHPRNHSELPTEAIIRGPGAISLAYMGLDLTGGPAQLADQSKRMASQVKESIDEIASHPFFRADSMSSRS